MSLRVDVVGGVSLSVDVMGGASLSVDVESGVSLSVWVKSDQKSMAVQESESQVVFLSQLQLLVWGSLMMSVSHSARRRPLCRETTESEKLARPPPPSSAAKPEGPQADEAVAPTTHLPSGSSRGS